MAADTWRRTFPTGELLDALDGFAELVAAKVAERSTTPAVSTIERVGYSPAEAAAYLGIGETTVRDHIRQGSLAAVKLGSRTVIHRDELERFLADAEPAVAS